MPVDEWNTVRVGVLGVTVENSDGWTTGGLPGGRNALTTDEKVVTRAINALDGRMTGVDTSVDGFNDRFNDVIGNETGTDQAAFDAIGKNLIQAVANLTEHGGGGGGGGGDGMALVSGATAGNFATFDTTGQVVDGGFAGADVLRRGIPGTYTRGVHFDISGINLQQFLDANINGRFFLGSVTIENGSDPRPLLPNPIIIRNLYMQGQTLNISSNSQFANGLTISGITGAIRISGDWGANNFCTTLSVQNVFGSVTLTGSNSIIQFNNADFNNCRDVRIDAGWDAEIRFNQLQLSNSNAILQGQGTAVHKYARTNLRSGSRLEIHGNLENQAVDLGTSAVSAIDRYGFVLDYRTDRLLETFSRRGSGGNGSGTVLAIPIFWIDQTTGNLMLKAAAPMANRFRINANGHLEYVVEVP